MSNALILVLILAIVAAVIVIVFGVLPLLKRRGISLDDAFAATHKTIDAATRAMSLVTPFLEQSKGVDVIDKIITSAKTGAEKAEQLYHIGKIPPEQRNAEAKNFVYDALKLAGVQVTPDIQNLVDGAVEAGAGALGHKTQSTDTEDGETDADEPSMQGIPAPSGTTE